MEQEALLCAKFILGLSRDGYYVENDVLEAAKLILNDYVSEYDCMLECDDEYSDEDDVDEY